jgi:hypothetical protein
MPGARAALSRALRSEPRFADLLRPLNL